MSGKRPRTSLSRREAAWIADTSEAEIRRMINCGELDIQYNGRRMAITLESAERTLARTPLARWRLLEITGGGHPGEVASPGAVDA